MPHHHNIIKEQSLSSTEQELHILGRQLLHRRAIIVDSAIDHIRLLLLEQDHARLDRVLDAQSRDDTGPLLPDTMASVCALPLRGRVPPWVDLLGGFMSVQICCVSGREEGKRGCLRRLTMKTRDASVRFSATPPALRETRKTSTSVLFMKYSILLWR